MSDTPLFPGFSDSSECWHADTLQLANWGGFDGYHRICIDPRATLIAGATGSGKSTLLDAYTALMMPSSVGFNAASNEAGSGRVRGPEQRNALSYVRGKTDVTQDGLGAKTDKVLRGGDTATWSAIAMTFRSSQGRLFTAIRVFHASASVTRDPEMTRKRLTLRAQLDLRELEPLHAGRFDGDELKATVPGVENHDTDAHFHDVLFRALGIKGRENAMRLLARVQAGRSVQSVTGLFTELVLEEPATYAAAERALTHFSELEQLYAELAIHAAKQELLEPIKGLHRDYAEARATIERLDRYGVRHPSNQPYDLWAVEYQLELLTVALAENATDREQVKAEADAAAAVVELRDRERAVAEDEFRSGGGEAVTRLELKLKQAQENEQRVLKARAEFEAETAEIGQVPSTRETYQEWLDAAQPFLTQADSFERDLENRHGDTDHHGRQLQEQLQELKSDLGSLERRQGLVPRPYDEARRDVAQACGLDPSELPFAAELMDVSREDEEWRLAAEVTLRPVALTMLIDSERQAEIRHRVDGLRLRLRLQFEGVELYDPTLGEIREDSISGRLIFKQESPFTPWLTRRVAAGDHLCVDSPAQLGGQGRKVTRNGQTSRGRRGAHGRSRDQTNIIGFSNEQRKAELAAQIATLESELDAIIQSLLELRQQRLALGSRQRAYRYVARHSWEEIDDDSARQTTAHLRTQLETLRDGDEALRALDERRSEAKEAHDAAISAREAHKAALAGLHRKWDGFIASEDRLTGQIADLQGRTTLDDAVREELTEALVTALEQPPAYGDALLAALRHQRGEMYTRLATQQQLADSLAGNLTGLFERYLERWENPNLTAEITAYLDFERIYDEVVGDGLFDRKEQFKKSVTRWTGEELIQLKSAYDIAEREIRTRLEPINTTLRDLPFGAGRDTLQIFHRNLHLKSITDFHRELSGLTDNIVDDLTYDSAQARYERLVEFMKRIARPAPGTVSERDLLLDVRRHIEITARRVDEHGRELSTYTTLDGKSGGESQELIAFISGAALLFQLADESQSRPRFAPVLLDEGFVKADSEHAGRAVDAWRRLGFQLLIAVPLDKVTSIEQHVQLRLSVNKSGDHSFVTELREESPFVPA